MAILYGTTGDGTTLPVLVDQFGNLLAKGIEGPPGPEGPPGIGQLPSDPYEGAILGWEDGELSWIGGSVPLPAGTYGPYTYIPGDERLDIPQDASDLVNGQQIYMSDFNGNQIQKVFSTDAITNVNGNVLTFASNKDFNEFKDGDVVQPSVSIIAINPAGPTMTVAGGSWYALPPAGDGTGNAGDGRYEPHQEWSNYVSGNFLSEIRTAKKAFDNDLATYCAADTNTTVVFNPSNPIPVTTSLRIYGATYDPAQSPSYINGSIDITPLFGNTLQWVNCNFTGTLNTLSWQTTAGNKESLVVAAIEIDGQILVDSSIPGGRGDTQISKPPMSGSGSVFLGTNGAILLRENNKEWVDDFYVTAPEQRIAARKVASSAIRRKKK